jgi:hypothetical protein
MRSSARSSTSATTTVAGPVCVVTQLVSEPPGGVGQLAATLTGTASATASRDGDRDAQRPAPDPGVHLVGGDRDGDRHHGRDE